jgi:hypothetical protein
METLLWLFVITSFFMLSELLEVHKMPEFTWYIIHRYWTDSEGLHDEELDAIECETTTDAIKYAKNHYGLHWGQGFQAEACLTMRDINRAKKLSMNCAEADADLEWTTADWKEFSSLPTYSGDQDQYLRTWTSWI